mmetsp:Transcript_10934/g.34852  ORF Transcript_10934/g.34852 Transcript_10934/m.34852 type:complete len:222 (+) Transcript_10934:77-742(+)
MHDGLLLAAPEPRVLSPRGPPVHQGGGPMGVVADRDRLLRAPRRGAPGHEHDRPVAMPRPRNPSWLSAVRQSLRCPLGRLRGTAPVFDTLGHLARSAEIANWRGIFLLHRLLGLRVRTDDHAVAHQHHEHCPVPGVSAALFAGAFRRASPDTDGRAQSKPSRPPVRHHCGLHTRPRPARTAVGVLVHRGAVLGSFRARVLAQGDSQSGPRAWARADLQRRR